MASSRREAPWWLTEETEVCPACSQAYAYHTEVRCYDCDGPMCPICVQTTVSLEFRCPECVDCEDDEEVRA